MRKKRKTPVKLLLALVLVVIAVFSITVLARYATSPELHADSMEILEEKKVVAMQLSAAVTVTSTAVSTLPGDIGTPIADQLSELTVPLLAIVCIIYLEKYLLTTMGFISFAFLLPAACLLAVLHLFQPKDGYAAWARKLLVLSVVVSLIVPVSVKVTSMIEETFSESVSQTLEAVGQISDEAEQVSSEEETNGFLAFFNNIGQGVTNLADSAKNGLSLLLDAIAVMLITTCVIPVVTALFFVWVLKTIMGIHFDSPAVVKMIPARALSRDDREKGDYE